jgi:hypothetical protein
MRWYEKTTALAGLAIIALSIACWWFGPHTLEWALHISEPTFLAGGALSIILLWAQLRAASAQEHEENVWKRIVCLHEHFRDIPRSDRTEAVRKLLLEKFPGRERPSAHLPLTHLETAEIIGDIGNHERATASVLISRYLNDWEDLCGAISVGLVDEDYARSMEGGRLIDTFFGFRQVIEAFREAHKKAQRAQAAQNAAMTFAHVPYTEIQDVAVRWHDIRHNEMRLQDERIDAANRLADAIQRDGERSSVMPKAKGHLD